MKVKPVIPREQASRDVDDAIAYDLGEQAERLRRGQWLSVLLRDLAFHAPDDGLGFRIMSFTSKPARAFRHRPPDEW